VFRDVVLIVLSGRHLDQTAGKDEVEVVVGRQLTRRPHSLGHRETDEFLQSRQFADPPLRPAVDVVVEPRGVGQQMPKSDGSAWIGLGDSDSLEIVVDVGVQVEFALLDQLEGRHSSEELRLGGGVKACRLGVHSLLARWVCSAVAAGEHGFPVSDDRDDCSGDLIGRQLLGHQPVDRRCELVAVRRRS
jgi:hypothetical protein